MDKYIRGRLQARPAAAPFPADAPSPSGCHRLNLAQGRDGILCIPRRYQAGHQLPLAVLFHGAGGSTEGTMLLLHLAAELLGALVLAPESRHSTWDHIHSDFGPDVVFLDTALAQTFARYNVVPHQIAVGGFSDGASYALSLGLTNGDLFSHIIAFAPGFVAPASRHGEPAIFVTHGLHDQVLPIESCSRRIVPRLRKVGYTVDYHEFAGGHTLPPLMLRRAARWFRQGARVRGQG